MSSEYTLSKFSLFSGEQPSLEQFVLLSVMIHVLVIVLFGDITGGGAQRGVKLWGALTVTVKGVLQDSADGLKLDRSATLVQPTRATPPMPASSATASASRQARVSAPVAVPQSAEDVARPAQAPDFEMPPVISTDVEKAVTEFVVPKPSADRVYVPPPLPVENVPPSPAVLPPPVPVVVPMEPKRHEETVAAPAPAPPPEPSPPKVVREVAKPVAPPEPAPRDLVAPAAQPVVQPTVTAPAKPEQEIVAPMVVPVATKLREIAAPAPLAPLLPSEPPARADAPSPPKIDRDVIKPAAPPAAAPVATPSPTPTRTPIGSPTGVPSGALGTDRDLLKPRVDATLPSTDLLAPATGKAPGIDLDAVRRRAREISSGGTGPRTVFPFPGTPPQKPRSKEQQAFDKALKKNDCRDAYADMGLAAVVPLVLSAVREDGCKW